MEEERKEIGVKPSRVKAVAAEMEKSAYEMAGILKVGEAAYRRKLCGDLNWTMKDLVKLVAVSGKSPSYFFGMSDH